MRAQLIHLRLHLMNYKEAGKSVRDLVMWMLLGKNM
jgi:hypothetical protein